MYSVSMDAFYFLLGSTHIQHSSLLTTRHCCIRITLPSLHRHRYRCGVKVCHPSSRPNWVLPSCKRRQLLWEN